MDASLRAVVIVAAVAGALACSGKSGPARDRGGGSGSGEGGQNNAGSNGGEGGIGSDIVLPPVESCANVDDATVGASELRRLSFSQYRHTVRDLLDLEMDPLLRFLPDGKTGPFDANTLVPATELDIEKYQDSARDLAARFAIAKVRPCTPAGATDVACRDRFVDTFGLRAYRRPLTVDEKKGFQNLFDSVVHDGFDVGVRLVVEAMLQSPNLIYLPEFGASSISGKPSRLNGYEMATRLALLLWESGPDNELLAAAQDGKLQSDDDLQAQVGRMTADPRFGRAARSFGRQWSTIDKIGEVGKDAVRYKFWGSEFMGLAVEETEKFFEQVFSKGDAKLSTLLLADYTYLNPEAPTPAIIYAVNRSAIGADGRTPLDPKRRSGFLTQLSVMSRTSTNERSAAINRGILIQENFLCEHLPSPPTNVDFSLPENADKLSPQELLREHQKNPTCKPCHQLIDPIGFTFSRYDGVGQYREQINGVTLDESGSLPGSDIDRDVVGARALSQALSESEKVKGCLAMHWFRYALGRDPTEDDLCTIAQVKQAGIDSDGDFRAMLAAMARSGSFRLVNGEAQ